jgi:hypothetical protein
MESDISFCTIALIVVFLIAVELLLLDRCWRRGATNDDGSHGIKRGHFARRQKAFWKVRTRGLGGFWDRGRGCQLGIGNGGCGHSSSGNHAEKGSKLILI